MALATAQGKDFALAKLRERRALPALPQDHNSRFVAGSPMQYNCDTCHAVLTFAEDWQPPRTRHCEECAALLRLGWMQ
jgi:hypothetical protein